MSSSTSTPSPKPTTSPIRSNEQAWSLLKLFSFSSPPLQSNDLDNTTNTGCPVLHKENTSPLSTSNETNNSTCPIQRKRSDAASACPITNGTLPSSIEESANHPQTPHPSQKIPLSTTRVTSSIPRSTPDLSSQTPPSHQPPSSNNWIYPSEQQFYNAMRRKGYTANETDMSTIVQIHNSVNERTWREVCRWESTLHDNHHPRLTKFVGRPNDTSPKAWINSMLFFYQKPFDRHDWYVEREGGEVTRYVIDFYNGGGRGGGGRGVNMYLDVRPALDEPRAFVDRGRMLVREMLPGIFGEMGGGDKKK